MFRAGKHQFLVTILGVGVSVLSLTGCAVSAAPSAADGEAAAAGPPAPPVCAELAEQLEILNFFPNVIAGEETSGAQLMADDVEALQFTAPEDLQTRLGELRVVMTTALGDPMAFDGTAFVDAKIAVEDWGLANC